MATASMDAGETDASTVAANAYSASFIATDIVSRMAVELDGQGPGQQVAAAFTSYGDIADPIDATVLGKITAAPTPTDIETILGSNPGIASGFSDATSYFAILELGAKHGASAGGPQAATGALDFTVNLSALPTMDNLLMGFYGGIGDGPTTVLFTVSVDGVDVVSQSWTDVGDAIAFFTDQFQDFGPIALLDIDANGLLDISVDFAVETQISGDAFFGGILIGDPPAAGPHDLLLV